MTDRTDSGIPPGGDPGKREASAPGNANYVLGVLFVVYVFNFIDRQLLSVFIGPIQEEFEISDTWMGVLGGFAFALFYTFAGIPIARWADRGNRVSIIAIGLTVWSAMTVASGLARSFTQLALARVGVGVGEAAGSPPAHSLISDYFPPERRTRALAIYAWGVYIGSALAYLGGGYMRAHFDWRTAFFVLGAPGLLFALVVRFTVREPPRGYSEHAARPAQASSLADTLRHLFSCRSWVHLVVGACFLSVTGYGILLWGFEFYARVHGLPPFDIGIWMAVIIGIGGSGGAYAGAALADRFGPGNPVWYMRLPAIVSLAGVPFGFVFLLAGSSRVSMLFFFVFYVLSNVYVPIMHTLNQNLSQLRMRATAAAILLFIINLVGMGAGPAVVGFLNDLYSARFGVEAIRYSLLTLASLGVLGAFFFHLSSRSLAGDLAKLEG